MKMKKKGYAMGGMKKGYSKGGMKKKGFAVGGMPMDAPKPPMGGGAPKMTPEMMAKAKKAAALKKKMGGRNMSAKPAMPMGGAPKPMGSPPAMPMGGAPKPPMGGGAPKMPMMKKGGMTKKMKAGGGIAKKGKAKGGKAKARGAGIAQRGVRPAQMR